MKKKTDMPFGLSADFKEKTVLPKHEPPPQAPSAFILNWNFLFPLNKVFLAILLWGENQQVCGRLECIYFSLIFFLIFSCCRPVVCTKGLFAPLLKGMNYEWLVNIVVNVKWFFVGVLSVERRFCNWKFSRKLWAACRNGTKKGYWRSATKNLLWVRRICKFGSFLNKTDKFFVNSIKTIKAMVSFSAGKPTLKKKRLK